MTSSLEEKIQALKDQNTANLKMGPTQISQQEADTLHTTWLNAETTAKGAPLDAADAKQAYYTYIDGDKAYKERLTKQYTAEAQELKAKMIKNYEKKESVIRKNMAYYHSQLIYIENINMIVMDLLEKIINGTYKIRVIETEKNTNHRKTFYLNEQSSSFKHWNILFLGMYIAFGILFIDKIIETKSYKIYIPLLLITIFFMTPWFQSMINAIISKGQSTANVMNNDVYTNWRETAANAIANSCPTLARSAGTNRVVYDPKMGGCSGTEYGCCPDGTTVQQDSEGSNCDDDQ